jgi:hypothetical protein
MSILLICSIAIVTLLDFARAYEEDGLVLSESGAIVMHLAERSDALMPSDPGACAPVCGRCRTTQSIEPVEFRPWA